MSIYKRIIFVCTGNTCRSPMAATIMVNLMPEMRVESRGMVVLFSEPYNPKAVAVAASHGMIMPSNTATQIDNTDFDNSTLVLTMNAEMKQKLYDTYDRAINVYTISEFVGEGDRVVYDPYGKGAEEYNRCFEDLYELVEKVCEHIRRLDAMQNK
ncbi:MAG: protein tyrosine phosphatase [Lachnospira sp.]